MAAGYKAAQEAAAAYETANAANDASPGGTERVTIGADGNVERTEGADVYKKPAATMKDLMRMFSNVDNTRKLGKRWKRNARRMAGERALRKMMGDAYVPRRRASIEGKDALAFGMAAGGNLTPRSDQAGGASPPSGYVSANDHARLEAKVDALLGADRGLDAKVDRLEQKLDALLSRLGGGGAEVGGGQAGPTSPPPAAEDQRQLVRPVSPTMDGAQQRRMGGGRTWQPRGPSKNQGGGQSSAQGIHAAQVALGMVGDE